MLMKLFALVQKHPVRRFGPRVLLWALLWCGPVAAYALSAPQGDAPTSVIYEGAAAEALRRGDEELAEAFRVRGVKIEARADSSASPDSSPDSKTYTEAMIRAAGQDDVPLVKLLLERGADIAAYSRGNSKGTALQSAVGYCRPKMVAFLIERGASLNELTRSTASSLLHLASGVGCTKLVDLLLAQGADVDAQNTFGDSVLYSAVGRSKQNVKIVEMLLLRGADPNKPGNLGYTPLMQAVLVPRTLEDELLAIEIIKLLLAHRANLDTRTLDYGDTALIWAVKLRHARIAEFLLQRGANFKLKDNEGHDALQHARELKYKEIELQLIRAGAG